MKVFLLVIIYLTGFSIDLLACKCGGPFSVEKEYPGAVTVFLGKVLKVEYITLGETMHPDSLRVAKELATESTKPFFNYPIVLKATFLVKKKYKGQLHTDTITIYTGHRGASCGFIFEENKEYVVYGQNYSVLYGFLQIKHERVNKFSKKNAYWTTHCTRTTESVNKEQALLDQYLHKN